MSSKSSSAIVNSLDMSLDEILAKKKQQMTSQQRSRPSSSLRGGRGFISSRNNNTTRQRNGPNQTQGNSRRPSNRITTRRPPEVRVRVSGRMTERTRGTGNYRNNNTNNNKNRLNSNAAANRTIRRETRTTGAAPYQSRRTVVYEDLDYMVDDMEGNDPFVSENKKQSISRNNAKGSIFSRLGAPKTSEFCIEVKNLNYDVLEADVHDLFSTVGKVVKAEILYDQTNRSTGIAKVYFEDLKSAENAIKDFDGRTLDGKPMSVTMDTSNVSKNKKSSMFGTAIRDSRNNDMPFRVPESRRGGRNAFSGRDRERGSGRSNRRDRSSGRNDKEEDNFMEDE